MAEAKETLRRLSAFLDTPGENAHKLDALLAIELAEECFLGRGGSVRESGGERISPASVDAAVRWLDTASMHVALAARAGSTRRAEMLNDRARWLAELHSGFVDAERPGISASSQAWKAALDRWEPGAAYAPAPRGAAARGRDGWEHVLLRLSGRRADAESARNLRDAYRAWLRRRR